MRWIVSLFALMAMIQGALADAKSDFISNVNSAWSSGNDGEILNLINSRLQTNSNDILALGIKQYFYVFCGRDLNVARSAADSFKSAVDSKDNEDAKKLAANMRDDVYAVSLSESIPISPSQINTLRTAFGNEFPFSQVCLKLVRKIESAP